MRKNVSGQYIYFTLVSAISGNQVVGASGAISGTKSLDGLSGMIVLSGNIVELGGGSYRANLYDYDTNGLQAGYLFTASGCVPVQYHFDMVDGNASGAIYPASGIVNFPNSGSISVNTFASGTLNAFLPDSVLRRDFSLVSGVLSGTRCILNAGRKLQNRVDLNNASGYIQVFQEDDITEAYRQPIVTTSGATPITRLG